MQTTTLTWFNIVDMTTGRVRCAVLAKDAKQAKAWHTRKGGEWIAYKAAYPVN